MRYVEERRPTGACVFTVSAAIRSGAGTPSSAAAAAAAAAASACNRQRQRVSSEA
jgi:hypothetical protein